MIDPATEDRIGEVADATAAEVDAAIDAANRAFKSWRTLNMLTRAELLHEAAAELRRIRPVVAEMLTREMGKPYKESFDEVSWSITAIDYYAEAARYENGKVIGLTVDGQLHFTPRANRLASSSRSCRSTIRSCCLPGKQRRRWRPATPSSSSRPI